MRMVQTVTGETIQLDTGDELLCSGRGGMSKAIITYNKLMGVTGPAAQISHVAKYIEGQVFEATTLNKWCEKKGYQKNPFKKWLLYYNGSVWVRKLQGVDIDSSQYIIEAARMLNTPYESGIPGFLELVLTSTAIKHGPAWLKRWARRHLETKNLHCSEANVIISQKMKYYNPMVRPNKMPPCQFWPGGDYETGLTKGSLSPPIQIK